MSEEKKIVDEEGIPRVEDCSFIKIPTERKDEIEKYLNEKEVPFRTFEDAGHAFCESEAEIRLRNRYRNIDGIEDENVIEQQAVDSRECLGQYLYSYLSEEGYLDNDSIDEIIEEYFEDDLVDEEEDVE
jgi:hypothetical protein